MSRTLNRSTLQGVLVDSLLHRIVKVFRKVSMIFIMLNKSYNEITSLSNKFVQY